MAVSELPVPPISTAELQQLTLFVGGCERSGTTLVGRILAERLSLVAVPEAYFHAVAFRRFGRDVVASLGLRHRRRRSWGLAATHPADRLTAVLVDRLSILQAAAGVERTRGTVESTPENVEIGSELLATFPDAHIVHLVRDPRAVVASLRRMDFGPCTAQECARLWKQRVASGLALEATHPDRVHRLRFEDLILPRADLGPLGRLAPLIATDFDPDRQVMIDHTSASIQSRSGDEPDLRALWAWRRRLSMTDIAIVEHECGELMRLFGYARDGLPDGRGSTRRRVDTLCSVVGELTMCPVRRSLRLGAAAVGRGLAAPAVP
ncbi:MAG: sulfotransferase [Actinomycetota bacterium]